MRALGIACKRFFRDVCYGIDAAHAIRHGLKPAPQPGRVVRVASPLPFRQRGRDFRDGA